MITHITETDNIEKVVEEFGISGAEVPCLTIKKLDFLAEYIFVLCKVRREARKLEADKNVPMSPAPRLLREMHETMLVLAGDMCANVKNYDTAEKIHKMILTQRVRSCRKHFLIFQVRQNTAGNATRQGN